MKRFALRLKQARENAGLTQEQLAETVGVTRQAVSRWEQGHTQPDLEMLVALSGALEVDTEFLIFGKPAKQYQRFQKKHIICAAAAFSVAFIIFLLFLFLEPYLKTLVHSFDFDSFVYFIVFRLLLPPVCCFALGFGVVSLVALFYPVRLSRRWRITACVCGMVAIAPSLLVLADDALALWIPGYSAHIAWTLYIRTSLLPGVHPLLFRLLPGIAGALCFFSFNKD